MPLSDLFAPTFPPDVFQISGDAISFHHFERQKGGGFALTAARESALPTEAWHEQLLGRSAEGAGAVREAVDGARRLAGGSLRRASLVVDDLWFRVFLVEFERIPGGDRETEEMVLWKLRKLLPFRPEELRFVWSRPAPAAGAANRYLVLGILERVAASIEAAFLASGVRIGLVEPASFALAEVALAEGAEELALVQAGGDSFQLSIFRAGSAVLYRSKRAPEDPAMRADLFARELDLTRSFVAQERPFPKVVRILEEPESGWRALEMAERILEPGSDLRPVALPPGITVPAEFPARLATRTLRAVGASLVRAR